MRTTTMPSTPSIFQRAAPPGAGDALAKVKEIALEEVPAGTILEIEPDAHGQAAYVAHMLNADGTPTTVYVDETFNFVRIE